MSSPTRPISPQGSEHWFLGSKILHLFMHQAHTYIQYKDSWTVLCVVNVSWMGSSQVKKNLKGLFRWIVMRKGGDAPIISQKEAVTYIYLLDKSMWHQMIDPESWPITHHPLSDFYYLPSIGSVTLADGKQHHLFSALETASSLWFPEIYLYH